MKSEELFQMVNGAEDKYIEEASEMLALQQEAREGVVVHAAPKSRRSVWKTVIVSAAATAAVVFGAFFLMRNVGKNGLVFEPADPYESSVLDGDIGNGNSAPESPVSSTGNEESVPPTEIGEPAYKDETKFKAVDPVDNRITYKWELEPDRITYEKTGGTGREYLWEFEDNAASLGYIKEFFGNENYFVNEEYQGNWQRCLDDGHFECAVPDGTVAYSPVGGKVITVAKYHGVYGNTIAVEIPEGKIFVIYHLDEVYVNVGDTVAAGQQLGVCGTSGAVEVGKPQLRLAIMKKTGYMSKGELRQTFTEDFDGLVLTVTTDKTEYDRGDTIYLTATLENTTDKDIYLYCNTSPYGHTDEFAPYFEDLIQEPIYDDAEIDMTPTIITLNAGQKGGRDFRFLTLTDCGSAGDELSPNYVIDASLGVHNGVFRVQTCPDPGFLIAESTLTEYSLEFNVTINP